MDQNGTQIFKTKVSIITIPRDDYWLFSQGVLQLLHKVSDSYDHSSYRNSIDESSDDDDDYYQFDDDSDDDGRSHPSGNGSRMSSGSISAASMSKKYNDMSNSIIINDQLQSEEAEKQNLQQKKNQDQSSINAGFEEEEDDGLFFHLAFTPEEVTLMCSSQFVNEYFGNALKMSEKLGFNASKLPEDFLMLQVLSDGYNIGKRVLELTEPLAKNDISLFFISNYFSDIVLVPSSSKEKVIEILQSNKAKEAAAKEPKNNDSAIESDDEDDDKDEDEKDLERKTFNLFKESNIHPKINSNIKLLLTGARSGDSSNVLKSTTESLSKLNTTIPKDKSLKGSTNNLFPPYFAITRTPTEEIALLLPQSQTQLRKLNYKDSNLLGSREDYFLPLVIDLKQLPSDLKGIVAGVALRLLKVGVNEMSYLSLGKSGVVMIPGEFLDEARHIIDH